ncbi:MAG: alkaline phosphatase family protein [Phycisphaerae bacterium]|nr:alkaline phosphatase family protein [Phycisphaerae bacterium]
MTHTGKLIVLGQDGAIPYLVAEGMASGALPNFARLAARGVFAKVLPHPSGVTPGNWAHVSTGALPWTTGISEFALHRIGSPYTDYIDAFQRPECAAETLWETLARHGRRSATISYPHGRPRSDRHHAAIGGHGAPGESAPYTTVCRSRGLFSNRVTPADPYRWAEHELLPVDQAGRVTIAVGPLDELDSPWLTLGLELIEGNRVRITCSDTGRTLPEISAGQWTPWIECSGHWEDREVACEFRVRPTVVETAARRLALYVGALQLRDAFGDPTDLTAGLRKKLGPYTEPLNISALLTGWIDPDGLMDEFRQQAVWQARAAVELTQRMGYAAVFSKWHAFDKFYHFFFQRIDPDSPLFQPDTFDYYERIHQSILRIADEMVGIVLDAVDDDTLLAVLSDHGLMPSRRSVNVNNYLADNGFLATKHSATEGRKIEIDWSKTCAVAHPFSQIWINKKCCDPDGIVERGAEYERARDEVIAALRDWKDPLTGKHVMTHVFRGEDGAFYGLGAPTDGDIRFYCQPGYSVFRSVQPTPDGQAVTDAQGPYLGDHGSCEPTARLGRGSETAMCFLAGPGVRPGYERRYPLRISDVLPTALTALRWPLPANSEGGVAMDCLEPA